MSIRTPIEWCDSSVNAMMGCAGCELWNPKQGIKRCYAGTLTERYGGGKGWPVAFNQPAIFPHRIAEACRWPDLTGTARPDKPWLDGLPRTIFLDDMGDTFSPGLPDGWLEPHIPAMAASPHIWIFLTKRPRRMVQFFERLGTIPANFWLGTTVTSKTTMRRAWDLLSIKGASVLWLSIEPLLESVALPHGALTGWCDVPCDDLHEWGDCHCTLARGQAVGPWARFGWVVLGGESGQQARPFALEWAEALLDDCQGANTPCFIKQLGARPTQAGQALKLKSAKGGDMREWPEALRVRQMPQWQTEATP